MLSFRCERDTGTLHWWTTGFKHVSMSEGRPCDPIVCSDHVPLLLQDGPQDLFTCAFMCPALPASHPATIGNARLSTLLAAAWHRHFSSVTYHIAWEQLFLFLHHSSLKTGIFIFLSFLFLLLLPFYRYSVSSLYVPGTSSLH